MHIPDGFLSAGVTGITWAGAGLGVAAALRAEKADPNPMPAGILGATAAFVFAAQMINVPVAPGLSGHLVGAALSAVLVGPWRAVIVMAVVLAVQALLFQDGGMTALGANTFDMGVAASLAGFAVASLVSRWRQNLRARVIGGVLGAFAATLVAAVLTGLWLGLSGLYPLVPVVQLMLVSHRPAARPDVRAVTGRRGRRRRRPVRRGDCRGSLPLAVRVGAAGRPRSRRGAPGLRHARVGLVAGAVSGLRAAVRVVARDGHGGGGRRGDPPCRGGRLGREPRRAHSWS
jgi:cobalt/nickel transport system permease protein